MDQIDVDTLLCYGLLLCQGKTKEKAQVFYNVLQEGGMDKHEFVAAEDKDFDPAFRNLCLLSTVYLFEWCQEIMNVDNVYEEEQAKLEKRIPDLAEQYLDTVYGYETKLDNKEWIEKICKKGDWVFSSHDLRSQLFKKAGLDFD